MDFKKILSLCLLLSGAKASECCEKTNFYILTESGWSWPTCPKFCVDGDYFIETNEGYDNRPRYGYVISAEIGVEFNNWLALGSSFNIRPLYQFCHTVTPVDTDHDARTVFFTLSNTSFMYVAAINRGMDPCWAWECGCFTFAPFVAGGVGLAYNTFGEFHVLSNEETTVGDLTVSEVLQEAFPRTTSHFAWQVQVGLEASYAERLSFGVAYRYFDGGRFCSPNYWDNYETTSSDLRHSTISPLNGRLRANELVFNLMINF